MGVHFIILQGICLFVHSFVCSFACFLVEKRFSRYTKMFAWSDPKTSWALFASYSWLVCIVIRSYKQSAKTALFKISPKSFFGDIVYLCCNLSDQSNDIIFLTNWQWFSYGKFIYHFREDLWIGQRGLEGEQNNWGNLRNRALQQDQQVRSSWETFSDKIWLNWAKWSTYWQ